MPNQVDPFDDGLGSDPIDRGSSKIMGGDGGGGAFMDSSYEDALRIMGRADELPSPFEQRALGMDSAGAELAGRLTALRQAAGLEVGPFGAPPTLGAPDEAASAGETVSVQIDITGYHDIYGYPEPGHFIFESDGRQYLNLTLVLIELHLLR